MRAICPPERRFAKLVLFDTHTHINDERFDADRSEVIENMQRAGVQLAVVVGDAAAQPESAFALADAYPFLYAAAGVHPHDAIQYNDAIQAQIETWMAHPKAVALGEIGLDYHYDLSPRDVQKDVFARQLALAKRLNKPVIIHIREAHGDAMDILRTADRPAGVLHCYTGSWESAKAYLDMGFYISLSGAVTFKNAPKLAQVAQNVPLDRLLVETDCPYMAPVPMRGKRNEPAFVAYTAQKVAELRGMDAEEFALVAYENGKRLFGI